ncbi:MAG: MBOAT family protein [Lachnospiraceae bacterium]|nr:MBOAT family protein [Lachnospiraceae bacterium]
MVFSSFPFLCFFLPAVFVLHTVLKKTKARNVILLAASLVFYAYGEPLYIFLLLFSAVVNYFLGRGLEKPRKGVLALGVVFNLALLLVFKYSAFLITELNRLLPAGQVLPVPQLALPIGISFYTFQILSYLIDVYRGETGVQYNFISLLLYISFFPQLIAGPIVKYHDVAEQIRYRVIEAENVKNGIVRFTVGLGKKVLIANGMAVAADSIYALEAGSVGTLAAWIGALAYMFQIYFDFSGYSDMALGLGQMFGFRFKENFNYPYASTGIRDFWRRWHISLSSWFRDYLYIPLGGNWKGKARTYLNLYIVFLATGIWHGASWTFLLWGLYHGTFLVLERLDLVPFVKNRVLGWLYSFFVVFIGWILFRSDTLPQAWQMTKALFGCGAAGGTSYALAVSFLSPFYLCLFGLAFLLSTPFFKSLGNTIWIRLSRSGAGTAAYDVFVMLGSLLILALCLMQLASDSYNPFIYFRF